MPGPEGLLIAIILNCTRKQQHIEQDKEWIIRKSDGKSNYQETEDVPYQGPVLCPLEV